MSMCFTPLNFRINTLDSILVTEATDKHTHTHTQISLSGALLHGHVNPEYHSENVLSSKCVYNYIIAG
jgi:hypothetical protein